MAEETLNPTVVETPELSTSTETQEQAKPVAGDDELLNLKAEIAKQKAAIDKATKEAAEYRRQLRAKQSEEEIAAEEKRLADEAKDQRLAELEKQVALAGVGKSVMAKLGGDAESSSRVAELLYSGDIDNALTEIQRIWTAREKALRLEYGKIPAPGVGAANAAIDEAIARAREIGKARADSNTKAQEAMKAYMR